MCGTTRWGEVREVLLVVADEAGHTENVLESGSWSCDFP